MKVFDCVQGSPEWHAIRAGKATASGIADATAEGRRGEPSRTRDAYIGRLVAERLTGLATTDQFSNRHTDRGTEREPAARAAYEAHTGELVQTVGFVLHPTIEFSGASPDGLVGTDGLVQIKCPTPHVHIEYLLAKKMPAAYVKQVAWELECTERAWCDFVSYCPEMPEHLQLFVFRYARSEDYLAPLRIEVKHFLDDVAAKIVALERLAA